MRQLNQQVEKMQREIALGAQKTDIIQRMSEEMQARFAGYIEEKLIKRKEAWSVQYGEEAKIETESHIETMLSLSNKMVAVASQQDDNSLIEIYDPASDFEKTTTVYTFHTSKITCLAEHRNMLLSGSIDCCIGHWDIQKSIN